MTVFRIKKDDTVKVITGEHAGNSGKVLQVLPATGRVLVEGINMVKKTIRKSQDSPQGGITDKEMPLDISNILVECPECKKGVRTKIVRESDKSKRECKGCGHSFDS